MHEEPDFDRAGETGDIYFELSFAPNVSLVSTVRRFVSDFYVRVLDDAELTSRVAVATHELLDNAVRYSADGSTSVRVTVRPVDDKVRVIIDTRNRVSESQLAILRATMDELARNEDPNAHYQVLMRRTAKRTDGSGLGLGRVRAEAEMNVGFRTQGNTVFVRAEALHPGRIST